MEICTAKTLFTRMNDANDRPMRGLSIELTLRCNLNCRHCYCVLPSIHPDAQKELALDQWQDLFRQSAELGTFEITMTGGEPMLHPDFKEIWKFAKSSGFFITLFSNGTLIDDRMAAFFREWTPLTVSISLYGASEETYRRVTGRTGMFAKAMRGIQKLADAGINLEIKGVFSKLNWGDYDAVREIVLTYCDLFRWDAELMGTFPGCEKVPKSLRVGVGEYVQKEYEDPERMAFLKKDRCDWAPAEAAEGIVFRCGVARGTAHIDPYGFMHPCLPLESIKYDVMSGSVKEGWERVIPEKIQNVPFEKSPCQTCEAIELCRFCPAFASLEGVPLTGPIPYKCQLARERAKVYKISDQLRNPPPDFSGVR